MVSTQIPDESLNQILDEVNLGGHFLDRNINRPCDMFVVSGDMDDRSSTAEWWTQSHEHKNLFNMPMTHHSEKMGLKGTATLGPFWVLYIYTLYIMVIIGITHMRGTIFMTWTLAVHAVDKPLNWRGVKFPSPNCWDWWEMPDVWTEATVMGNVLMVPRVVLAAPYALFRFVGVTIKYPQKFLAWWGVDSTPNHQPLCMVNT